MTDHGKKKSFCKMFNDAASYVGAALVKRPAKILAVATALGMTLGFGGVASSAFADTVSSGSAAAAPSIVLPATALPKAAQAQPKTVELAIETVEVTGTLDDGASYTYWTFGGKVPGPFVRVREGDSVHVTLKNAASSKVMHNVDFHAVTGPGGGAGATMSLPAKSGEFTFKAQNPGLYVYHCATPPVALHIAKGMYGLILVEPKIPLKPVDREFYVMQGEIYTQQEFGASGVLRDDMQKLLNETPEYYVFNGAVGALVNDGALKAKVGETIRIYFGVGGPNKTSSFHVIGEVFDKVYEQGSLTSEPLTNVQTVTVAPGGATVVEFKVDVPGKYMLVDHALSRAARGLLGVLEVEGPENHDIFKPGPKASPPLMKH